ncbi:hypothetical protein M8C21_025652, partial [Ambrosia artemisiifolia]
VASIRIREGRRWCGESLLQLANFYAISRLEGHYRSRNRSHSVIRSGFGTLLGIKYPVLQSLAALAFRCAAFYNKDKREPEHQQLILLPRDNRNFGQQKSVPMGQQHNLDRSLCLEGIIMKKYVLRYV